MSRRILAVIAVMTSLAAAHPGPAGAQGGDVAEHKSGGLGFHDVDAPIGGRWWLSGQKVALDLGVGYQAVPAPDYNSEHLKTFAIDAGLPIRLKSWHQMHLLARPGFFYQTRQVQAAAPPAAFDTENQKTIRISGELEAEAFLLDNFSVSASHGIIWSQFDPGFGAEKQTTFGTLGRGFTSVGFHVYLFGG
jgi:hypothetical protein